MDFSTLTLVAGLISCVIGIATFVVGMNSRAQKEGILEQKINQALEGIEEIKEEVKSHSSHQNSMALLIQAHEEQLKTAFKQLDSINQRQNTLDLRLSTQDHIATSLEELITIMKNKE